MKVAYISTYLPRACGIATFNSNVIRAIGANLQGQTGPENGFGVALNDSDSLIQYEYPAHVQFVIRQEHQKDYILAATYINTSDADVCLLEHEFGIFGGESGIHLLPLLHRLEKPLVTVLHTILREPSHAQKIIIQEIAQRSAKLLVMSRRGIGFLTSIYGIELAKIQLIEHGVPDLEAPAVNPLQALLPFRGHRVLFSFGLLSRNKGLETVIRALPAIVARYPDVVYVVLGNTHPGVVRHSGEEYREQLKLLALQLKVTKHLVFINKFVSENELINYLTAATLYLTPYTNEAQITSGTLSYAVGAGAAVVSTPYWHAQELLADGRGRLFPFKDAEALADVVNELLSEPDQLRTLQRNAYRYGLHLRWPIIGASYLRVLTQVVAAGVAEPACHLLVDPELMPAFSLAHVRRLTDDTGIVQHAKYGIPNLKEGYCLDDNSRALIMALMAYQQHKSQVALDLLPIYLSYIHYVQRDDGNFRNFLSFKREYLDEIGSEDSFGRTVWALGYLINCAPNNSYREFAGELFFRSVPHFRQLHHLRGIANTIIGLAFYLKTHPDDEAMLAELNTLTAKLLAAYDAHCAPGWHWFEEKMTYDNAILPLALLHAAASTGAARTQQVALEALAFLDKLSFRHGYLSPVGNQGWLHQGELEPPLFDQQAIETMAMVLMYLQAYQTTHQPEFIEQMFRSYQWFLGENILRVPLYDQETKGCCDGLQETALNRNQGAESTLAYLISHLTVLKALELEHEYDQASQAVGALAVAVEV